MTTLRIYLAGPMRGIAEFNHPAFRDGAAKLRACGHEVFSPADHDVQNGFSFEGMAGTEATMKAVGFDLRAALGADLAWICASASAVVVLPGWQRSLGARAEAATAVALGLPVWELAAFLAYGADAPAAEVTA